MLEQFGFCASPAPPPARSTGACGRRLRPGFHAVAGRAGVVAFSSAFVGQPAAPVSAQRTRRRGPQCGPLLASIDTSDAGSVAATGSAPVGSLRSPTWPSADGGGPLACAPVLGPRCGPTARPGPWPWKRCPPPMGTRGRARGDVELPRCVPGVVYRGEN